MICVEPDAPGPAAWALHDHLAATSGPSLNFYCMQLTADLHLDLDEGVSS